MKNRKFKEKYAGQDAIVGRPPKLNFVELEPLPGKKYAELIFWGDVHYGYPTCRIDKAKAMLDWAVKNHAYILLMGDLLEAGLRDSVGDSVYRQRLNPQEQMEEMVEILEPAAKAGLIIGLHRGNHENRITKATGIDISKVMARLLDVRYLGSAFWSALKVGNITYSLYSTHGFGGARFKHSQLKKAIDLCGWINSDILAMGHVHSIAAEPIMRQYYDRHLRRVVTAKQYVILTGSYMDWNDSYAEEQGYPVSRIGSPKVKLLANENDVHARV